LPQLLRRESKIAGDRVADRAPGDGDAALARVDLRVGGSKLGLKSNNRETDGERQIAAPKSPSPLAWR
jgi:hypothetical protein